MSPTFSTKLLVTSALLLAVAAAARSEGKTSKAPSQSALVLPIGQLFDHAKHREGFAHLNVRCTDCHNFSMKPRSKDEGPLSAGVPRGMIQAPPQVCHQCHLGKVALPRPNQCLLCHTRTEAIMPADHLLGWRTRHGRRAQMDQQSCRECHTASSCSTCHSKLDVMTPLVHRPNFRITHSIEARANPQSCVQCHRTGGFCKDCHTGSGR